MVEWYKIGKCVMKKKGFTLIELLAVIVILAIIALIITPIVSNVIDSARKAAFKESVNGMIDSTNNYVSEYILEHNNELTNYPVTFVCDGNICKTTDNKVLTFSGSVPKSGSIIINEGGILAEYISDGKYCAYGYKWNLVIEDGCSNVDESKPIITGTKNGKKITLAMTDSGSGVDSYCASTTDDSTGCDWVTPSNPSSEKFIIPSVGTRYFFAKDRNGNISDSISFTTTAEDYCTISPNTLVYESLTAGMGSYTVPTNCDGTYKLEVWGAAGSYMYVSGTFNGSTLNREWWSGRGAYSRGNVTLEAGDVLYIAVGGKGENRTISESSTTGSTEGGYNGGGSVNDRYSGAGGGATHISKTETLLKDTAIADLYIVAGGGGGAAVALNGVYPTYGSGGGDSGGLNAYNGSCYACASGTDYYGHGGTQEAGGSLGGSFGQGGNATAGGGGGGGFYGGGAGTTAGASGGGGSSYIGGVTDGVTYDGKTQQNMPNGGSNTGNFNGGAAKIYFVSE